MTEKFIIEIADNGIIVKSYGSFKVYEDTNPIDNSKAKDNACLQLGKLFYSTIKQATDELHSNKIKMKIEITNGYD